MHDLNDSRFLVQEMIILGDFHALLLRRQIIGAIVISSPLLGDGGP